MRKLLEHKLKVVEMFGWLGDNYIVKRLVIPKLTFEEITTLMYDILHHDQDKFDDDKYDRKKHLLESSHHYEHWYYVDKKMPLYCIIHMICDWMSKYDDNEREKVYEKTYNWYSNNLDNITIDMKDKKLIQDILISGMVGNNT